MAAILISSTAITECLRMLAALPDWLIAAVQPDRLRTSLLSHVPEFASGRLVLRSCEVKRIELERQSERWTGRYSLVVEDPGSGEPQVVRTRGTLTPPWMDDAQDPRDSTVVGVPGTAGWRCYLPDLHLELEAEGEEDEALAAVPRLTDAPQARAVLEGAMRRAGSRYREVRVDACEPKILSYKPGSSCVIRYDLEYPTSTAAPADWPRAVIAKVYRSGKGENAFEGMRALWDSPLAGGGVVAIAEPLAYLPELRTLLQRPLDGDRNLEDVLKKALATGAPEDGEELYGFVRMTADGLAAMHSSGVRHRRVVTWGDFISNVQSLVARLAAIVPQIADAAAPVVRLLEEICASYPPDPPVPSHGTLAPEQVLINGRSIGFIDFDDFCEAEPAMDVGRFCTAIMEAGISSMPDPKGEESAQGGATPWNLEAYGSRLAELDALAEAFVQRYESLAPISRQRVALWEGTEFLKHALHYWLKVKRSRTGKEMVLLEHYLRKVSS